MASGSGQEAMGYALHGVARYSIVVVTAQRVDLGAADAQAGGREESGFRKGVGAAPGYHSPCLPMPPLALVLPGEGGDLGGGILAGVEGGLGKQTCSLGHLMN